MIKKMASVWKKQIHQKKHLTDLENL
jgi:hypothetical protein